jgi:hypothetical protein
LDLWKVATKYMFGRACIAECIVWDAGKKTRVHLVPRPGSAAAQSVSDPTLLRRTFDAPPFFSFHHANAYEAGGNLVIDTVANHDGVDLGASFDSGPGYYDDNVGRGTLTRLVLDLGSGAAHLHRLMHRACEFPSVAPAGKAERCVCVCMCVCVCVHVCVCACVLVGVASPAMGKATGIQKQGKPCRWPRPCHESSMKGYHTSQTCHPAVPQ